MHYTRTDLQYTDYYLWTPPSDKENPYYHGGNSDQEFLRQQGYEVLLFINHFAAKYWPTSEPSIRAYQKIEKMLRYELPQDIKPHIEVECWLISNWLKVH